MAVLESSSDDDDVPLATRATQNEQQKKSASEYAPNGAAAAAAAEEVVLASAYAKPRERPRMDTSEAPRQGVSASKRSEGSAAGITTATAGTGTGTSSGFVIPKRPRADSSSSDDDNVPLAQRAKVVELEQQQQLKKKTMTTTTTTTNSNNYNNNNIKQAFTQKPAAAAQDQLVRPIQSRPMMVPQIAKNPSSTAVVATKTTTTITTAKVTAKQTTRSFDSSDDDEPLAQKKKSLEAKNERTKEEKEKRRREKKEKKRLKKEKKREQRRRRELEKSGGRHTVKLNSSSGVKKKRASTGCSGGEGGNGKGSQIMWTQLEHEGVVFPPPYEPHGVPLTYDGKDVYLEPHEEEVATFFAVMKETDYASKPVFQENFMDGFKRILRGGKNAHITDFTKCNFQKIYDWDAKRREINKERTSAEKKQIKEDKDKAEEKYTWAIMDGKREQVGNFRVEPPGLFRGRGEHPKMGKIKRRIQAEDIIINIGKDAKIPEPPAGHRWKEVRHDQTVTWMAGWNDSINTKDWKYVQFGATSSVKSESDKQKFEKARNLHKFIGKIRLDYRKNMQCDKDVTAQLAVTTYLVDKLALRAGGEKDEDLADTVGVTTLRVGHLKFMGPEENHPYPKIEFDFLGKDSIRYHQEHAIERVAYDCMKKFCKGKKEEHDVFDHIDPSKVNAHLQTLMPGLTIKVFRTYNASITLYRLLEETTKPKATVPIMKATYDEANKEVAILCNHQKGESKQHAAGMEKLEQTIKSLEKELKELKKKDKKDKKIPNLKQKIDKMNLQMETKESLKTVSLGTSKINYLDPRITIAWCKKNEVPLPTVYTKALVQKFNWAMCEEPDYVFADLSYNIERDNH
jgi:DNA topoisomerase I